MFVCGADYMTMSYISAKYTCEDGYYVMDLESIEICSGECNEDYTDCMVYLENEGDECVYGTYTEKCTNGVVDYCDAENDGDTGSVTAFVCREDDTCKSFTSINYANCYSDEDVCTNVGEESTKCFEYGNYGNVVGKFSCLEASDGSAAYNVIISLEEQCLTADGEAGGECNAAGTGCKE